MKTDLFEIIYNELEFQLSDCDIEEWQIQDYTVAIIGKLRQHPFIVKEFLGRKENE